MSTHDCPGDCGRQVAYHLFSCRACWYRLPKLYRDEIWRWYQVDTRKHADAMLAAKCWYRDNGGES